tara:strand:+ start:2855 stop:3358 length:504 start_codon:yes stop_codon:yes gene_type:complete
LKKNHWNITAPKHYINQIQTSKYFKQDLGRSAMIYDEKKGDKELREGEFTTWYYNNYKSLVVKSGFIGPLHFYIDYYIKKDILGFFLNTSLNQHQYAIDWDQERIDIIGIDSWLSEKLRTVDESLDEDTNKEHEVEEISGDGSKLMSNPGGASWKDVEDHYNKLKGK